MRRQGHVGRREAEGWRGELPVHRLRQRQGHHRDLSEGAQRRDADGRLPRRHRRHLPGVGSRQAPRVRAREGFPEVVQGALVLRGPVRLQPGGEAEGHDVPPRVDLHRQVALLLLRDVRQQGLLHREVQHPRVLQPEDRGEVLVLEGPWRRAEVRVDGFEVLGLGAPRAPAVQDDREAIPPAEEQRARSVSGHGRRVRGVGGALRHVSLATTGVPTPWRRHCAIRPVRG
mmetsp:Transcript_63023/g.176264  ORF Transcript_63023/g.176264 Transcript_63023/m.176264 type:complete len:229 (-) Transcript_63023:19-705(-)